MGPHHLESQDIAEGLDSPCMDCRHYDWKAVRQCRAFQSKIPSAIWSGEDRHFGEFPGDGGLHFEPDDAHP